MATYGCIYHQMFLERYLVNCHSKAICPNWDCKGREIETFLSPDLFKEIDKPTTSTAEDTSSQREHLENPTELSTEASKNESTLQLGSASGTNTASIDFLKLYNEIVDAEDVSMRTAQELILHYFYFGKALEERYKFYRDSKRTAQGLVNDEVRKQIPESISESLLRKTKERVQKIYDLFSELGPDRIKRIQTFTVVTITKLSQDDIMYWHFTAPQVI
ncbi:hypothetical protein C1645_735020 [Glomus cerebriforme]|uniref:Uncharacterized protein n=1 Tax=Glomus cerebriforme TaxID=658196 RepID=A0A397TCU3_9GLOM|nr:hypothetical protein C1645_735020 [Glomus cerebriforme]